jgi:hypothetical protein
MFRRHLRIIRNSEKWVSTRKEISGYVSAKKTSRVEVSGRTDKLRTVTVKNSSDIKTPLTIIWKNQHRLARLTGSINDGVYIIRGQELLFDAIPGKPVTIEVLE